MITTVKTPADDMAVINLDGKFTIEDVHQFRTKTGPLLHDTMKTILICCSKLEFIDSSGIGSLILLMNTSRNLNIELVVYDMQDAITRVFKTAFLDKFFRMLTLEDARGQYPGLGL
jgi:anti-sigma B factor antagonist